MACLHPVLGRNGWILTNLAHIYIVGTWTQIGMILVTLTPFQGHTRSKNVDKCLRCPLFSKGVAGFLLNLHKYIAGTLARFVALIIFSR